MTAIYTGSLYDDPRYLDVGWKLYVRSLRALSNLLSDVSIAKSDEAPSAAIALLVYEMRSCATVEAQRRERTALLQQILAARATLRGIRTEFSMSVSTLRAGHEPQAGFIGPIPHHFFDRFSKLSIHGLRHSILPLNYLIMMLTRRSGLLQKPRIA